MLFTQTLYIGLLKHIVLLAITLASLQWEVIRNRDQILQRCPERRYLYKKIESRIRFDPRRTLQFPEFSVTFSVSSRWTDVNLQTARGESQCPEVYTCSAKRIHLSKCRATFMLEGKTKHFRKSSVFMHTTQLHRSPGGKKLVLTGLRLTAVTLICSIK